MATAEASPARPGRRRISRRARTPYVLIAMLCTQFIPGAMLLIPLFLVQGLSAGAVKG